MNAVPCGAKPICVAFALGYAAAPPYHGAMRAIQSGAAALAALAVLAFLSTAEARQDDPRLDALFARLEATADKGEALAVQAEIWRIWIESGDEDLDALMATGANAMQARHFDPALESFNAIIEADPDFAEGWNKRATLYYLMGLYEESIEDVERTLALEPRHFGALSGMGLIHTELEDPNAALAWFEQALAVNPHMPFIAMRAAVLRKMLEGEPI